MRVYAEPGKATPAPYMSSYAIWRRSACLGRSSGRYFRASSLTGTIAASSLHHAGRIAEVMELAVAPGHRGRGLGARLLAEAERIALENGCVQIELACNRLRTNAHRFYEREGMKNFHCKFSKPLVGGNAGENRLGR